MENNHLKSKPRVNSAPEVLLVTSKKNKSKIKLDKKIKNERKSSQSSISLEIFPSPDGLNTENYLSISRNFSLVSGRRLSSINQNKEKFEIQFCRINVLLISMQLGLGLSMSGLGVYLRSVSPSLTWKDCTYWAGIPLLCSGAFGLYFCLSDREIYKRTHLSRLVRVSPSDIQRYYVDCGTLSMRASFLQFSFMVDTIMCSSLSVITAALTLSASLMSGSHGKWISDFSSTCDLHFITEHSESNTYPEKCCEDKHTNPISKHRILPINETQCICKTATNGNFSLLKFEKEYTALTCRYVFSALKDYFILQSSLMGVATGVCIWIVILHIRTDHSSINQESNSEYQNEKHTVVDESPSPSFLRFFPSQNYPGYINRMMSPSHKELRIPRVIIHGVDDKSY